MRILSFDTSAEVLVAAVFDGTKKIAAFESDASAGRHSEFLIPELQKLLRAARTDLHKLDLIAVGLGPGSFTGLRVGVTAAKILAFSTRAKVIGVSSLEGAARELARDGVVAVTRDARKSQVYAAVYR